MVSLRKTTKQANSGLLLQDIHKVVLGFFIFFLTIFFSTTQAQASSQKIYRYVAKLSDEAFKNFSQQHLKHSHKVTNLFSFETHAPVFRRSGGGAFSLSSASLSSFPDRGGGRAPAGEGRATGPKNSFVLLSHMVGALSPSQKNFLNTLKIQPQKTQMKILKHLGFVILESLEPLDTSAFHKDLMFIVKDVAFRRSFPSSNRWGRNVFFSNTLSIDEGNTNNSVEDASPHVSGSGSPISPWGLKAIGAQDVWGRATGQGAIVLVLDSGIDGTHPEFAGRLVGGRSFIHGKRYDMDDMVHGTHVAGTIVGRTVGVARGAELLAGKVCAEKRCPLHSVLEGLDWAVEMGVDVVNVSLGSNIAEEDHEDGGDRGWRLLQVVRSAYSTLEARGIVVVAASGNDSKMYPNTISYPAKFSSTIAVGSVNSSLRRSHFSQYDEALDIVAPGENIVSSIPLNFVRVSMMWISGGASKKLIFQSIMKKSKAVQFPQSPEVVPYRERDGSSYVGKAVVVEHRRGDFDFVRRLQDIEFRGASIALVKLSPLLRTLFFEQDQLRNFLKKSNLFVLLLKDEEFDPRGFSQAYPVSLSVEVQDTRGYYAFRGTSMAAPHVSGVVSLVKGLSPELGVGQVRSLLSDTSKKLRRYRFTNKVGAGLVQASAVNDLQLQ